MYTDIKENNRTIATSMQIIMTCENDNLPLNANAYNLLLETCAVESDMQRYDRQIGGGPAKGIFQCEPDTLADIRNNFIKFRSQYHRFLEGDLLHSAYAVIIARMHYLRVPEAIPDNRYDRGLYWKKYYNTHLGKGTHQDYLTKAHKYITYNEEYKTWKRQLL